MKKSLTLFLALIMCIGSVNGFAAGKQFTDVKTSDWFYNDVKTAVELGLVNGRSETTYAPSDNLTYAEAIKLAACMNQLYTKGLINIKVGNPWYSTYVEYCQKNNIIKKDYNYSENATRAGYMEIFANALPGDGLKAINSVADNSIPDVPSAKSYAAGVYKLYRAGILQGVDAAHNCNPNHNITRAEVAAILTRMMNPDKRVKFTLGEVKTEEKEETAKKLAISTQPKAVTVEFDQAATFSVAAKGGTEPYKYQWMYYVTEDSAWRDVSPDLGESTGEKTSNVTIKNYSHGTVKVRCVVTDSKGTKAVSESADFITKEKAVTEPLKVTKHPIGGALDVGGTIITNITVSGGVAPYTYQWQYNDGSGWKDVTSALGKVDGATGNKISIKATSAASYKVHCVIKDSKGNEITTNETDFVFNQKVEAIKLSIEKQPENMTAEVGKPMTTSVKVTGGTAPYTYQWVCDTGSKLYSLSNAVGVTGADTPDLTYIASSVTSMKVLCIVNDAKGASVTSKAAELVSTKAKEEPKPEPSEPLKITKQPESKNISLNETVPVTVEVAGGVPGYTFQWFYENCEAWDKLVDGDEFKGAKSNILTVTGRQASVINLMCEVKDSKGNKVLTNRIKLSILPGKGKFEFETHPVDTTVAVGEEAKLSVKVRNGEGKYTYLWQMSIGNGWARMGDQELIQGTTTPELTIKSKAAAYIDVRCIVKDSTGTIIESNKARVTFK